MPEKVFTKFEFSHPIYSIETVKAQPEIEKIQGDNNTWFCGAWNGFGFHEDGLQAGLEVAAALGSPAPWRDDIIPISPASMAVRTLPFKAVA